MSFFHPRVVKRNLSQAFNNLLPYSRTKLHRTNNSAPLTTTILPKNEYEKVILDFIPTKVEILDRSLLSKIKKLYLIDQSYYKKTINNLIN